MTLCGPQAITEWYRKLQPSATIPIEIGHSVGKYRVRGQNAALPASRRTVLSTE